VTIAATTLRSADVPTRAYMPAIPGFARDDLGRPRIGLDPEDLDAYGHLIRLTEQLILDQFSCPPMGRPKAHSSHFPEPGRA
jgi:hypothetical protein